MKFRFILLSFLLFSIGNSLNAQFIPFDNLCATCSPSPSSFSNQSSTALGIEPSFAIISQGIAVDLPLTYMMPQQFEVGPPISPIPITADVYFINLISINWGGIVGLSCTPDALTYDPDVNRFGCINICGTTNSAPGTYDVSVKVYAEGGAAGQTGGDTALVDFQVLILPPGNPYFTATPPESCQDTANIDLTVNENTFASLYDLNVYPTQYVWSLPYGNSANGATPPNFDIYSTESVTLTANRYEYIVTEVAVTSVNGNWWAGLFDDGAILGGSDPDLEFSMSNGSNSTSGGEVGNNFSPVWDLTSSPFSLTDQAISISFQENDLIGSDNGGTYTFTVNGSGNYNFGTSTSNIQGYVTIGTQLVDFIETTDTIKINPAPFVTNVSMSDSICQGDSILLSASASFTDFEWFNENGVLIDTTQTIFVKDEGAYYVKARVNSSALCKGTSNNYNIYTFPISTPVIAISSTGGLEIDNPNGYDIQWYSNGVPIPGAVTEELLDLSSGNPFSVTVTNSNGCSATSVDFEGCLGGYADAPNGTDVVGGTVTSFEAVDFAYNSHMKALKAQAENRFQDQIVPIEVEQTYLDENGKKATRKYTVTKDEGPRKGSSVEALAKLRAVFAAGGSVTAGNSSQMSDGAAFVMVMSEEMVKELNLEPIARVVNYAAAGVEPRIMGIGPVAAIPKVLKQAGLQQNDIDLIELNEAFASQSLAVMRELDLNQEIVNVNGGAIALGHPLGCTGAKLSVQLFDEMRKRNMKNKYGMVTMCVGTGQGAAGVFEFLS